MMKKLLAMLLALAMMLGCVAFGEGVDYTGTWVMTGAEFMGMTMGPSALTMDGMEFTMTLNADGTAVLTMGEEEAVTWVATENGVALTDASDVTDVLVYQDEMLVLEAAGEKMMFTREGAEPAVQEETGFTILANVDAKEFEGQWLLTSVRAMGMEIPAEALGLHRVLVLSVSSGIYGATDENGEMVYVEATYNVYEVEGVGTALDVAITDPESGESVVFLTMNKLADGNLVCSREESDHVFSMMTEEVAE